LVFEGSGETIKYLEKLDITSAKEVISNDKKERF